MAHGMSSSLLHWKHTRHVILVFVLESDCGSPLIPMVLHADGLPSLVVRVQFLSHDQVWGLICSTSIGSSNDCSRLLKEASNHDVLATILWVVFLFDNSITLNHLSVLVSSWLGGSLQHGPTLLGRLFPLIFAHLHSGTRSKTFSTLGTLNSRSVHYLTCVNASITNTRLVHHIGHISGRNNCLMIDEMFGIIAYMPETRDTTWNFVIIGRHVSLAFSSFGFEAALYLNVPSLLLVQEFFFQNFDLLFHFIFFEFMVGIFALQISNPRFQASYLCFQLLNFTLQILDNFFQTLVFIDLKLMILLLFLQFMSLSFELFSKQIIFSFFVPE